MIKLSDKHQCKFCDTIFDWKCTVFKNIKVAVYRNDNILKNVKNVNETEFQYIIELQCPNCLRRHFVEIDK